MRWNPVAPLLALARERAAAWMRRRQGADLLPVALERRRLYILPTGTGVAFAALLFLMLIAGLNYGNSLALFLTFLLGAFALVAMQQCHRNLLGIAVLTVSAPAVFARARGAVQVTLANPAGLARYGVEAALPESPAVAADLISREPRRGSRSSRAGWSTPKLTASATGSRFPGCGCRRIAVPSTAIAASPRSRCLGPKAMPAAAPSEADRRLPPLAWACAAFAGGVLLNVDRVPPWASAVALFLIAWRLTGERAGMRLPGTVTRALLALALVAVVLLEFHTVNGLAAGTALLMVMSGLKLLETRARRDQFVMVGAGLSLLLAAFLDRQTLARAPLYALEAWLACSALAAIASEGLGVRAALRLAGGALLIAMPLAVLLFLFFPRLPGAFWAIPRGAEATTGLSDTMSPGSIVKLVADYEPAFRVQFVSAAPAPEERYWRGPVLHDFDGHTWRRSSGAFHPRERLQYIRRPYRYRVALEPRPPRWWLPPDAPP